MLAFVGWFFGGLLVLLAFGDYLFERFEKVKATLDRLRQAGKAGRAAHDVLTSKSGRVALTVAGLIVIFTSGTQPSVPALDRAWSWMTPQSAPEVHQPFQRLYRQHSKKLGSAVRSAEVPNFSYMAVHEHATVLLFSEPMDAYIVWDNGKLERRKRRDLPDPKSELCNNDARMALARLFPAVPNGLHPPYCFFASEWRNAPEEWSRIGWRRFHCGHSPDLHRQLFEGGEIVGPYRNTQGTGHDFALFNDGTWENAGVMSAVACDTRGLP